MKKAIFAALLAALTICCCSCAAAGKPTPYAREHEHVYGFWYEAEDGSQVRYCKICHHAQTQGAGE